MNALKVAPARSNQIEAAAALFDQYRQFYGQPADRVGAELFLRDRLSRGESFVFVAWRGDEPVGFTQLYPSFSSIRMQPTQTLNDLYVAPEHRRTGVAPALLRAAESHARSVGAAFMALSTARDNRGAQRLYEVAGWVRDPFLHYVREMRAEGPR